MLADWHEVVFSDFCDITRGGSPRPIHDYITTTGIPWVKIADVARSGTRFIYETKEFIRPEGENKSRRVFPGDLILSNSATPGIPMFMGIEACIHDGWMLLRNFRRVDKLFVFYLLQHERGNLLRQGNGSVFTNLKTDILKSHRVKIPLLDEQRAIASVLGSLDDKIEQNRRAAQALEKLARAIFRAWFVDFEPVKAKAAGATRFPSMPQSVFDALPTRFVDSDIGLVPEGWAVRAIGDVVSVKGGATPSTKEAAFWDSGTHCWATPKDMSRLAHPVLLDTERRITDAGAERISSGMLPVGTVLMSSRAPVGYLAITGVPTAINQGFIAMVCDGPLPPVYVFNWAACTMDTIKAHASGTTFAEISKRTFRPLPIVEPAPDVTAAYREQAEPLFALLTACVKESEKLAGMRDYLLPHLLSGKVRVGHSALESVA